MAIDRPPKAPPAPVQVNERAASAAQSVSVILQKILHRTLVDGYYGKVTLTVSVENGQMKRLTADDSQTFKF